MASIKIDDLSSVKPFDPHGDPSSVGRRWQRWIKSFSLYADGLIIQADKDDNKVQRRALLLHSAGEDVQEIFETLADTGGIKDYGKAEKALNDYFIPKVNSIYQNHVFRSMEQHDGETVAQFVTRLRHVVKDCDYGEQAENQIRDQVVQRCKSHELRRQLLDKGEKLTLELLLSTAANHERVQSQLESMESGKNGVNAVREKQQDKTKESTSEVTKQAIATDVGMWVILDETLNVLLEEKPAISVEELTTLVPSVKQRKQPNLPNLDVEGSQKERIRRENQSGMWKVKERKMSMHLL